MDEMAGVRKELQRSLGQELPNWIWRHKRVRKPATDYLNASSDTEREDCWSILEDEAGERLAAWTEGQKELLRGVQSGNTGGSQDMHRAASRDSGGYAGGLDPWELFGDRTKAMTKAMSELFALIGNQTPEVKEFREKVLGGRFLAADEAHVLIASPAARTLDRRWFEEWDLPFVGHRADVLDSASRHGQFSPVNDWMKLRIDPPGITKTVRYADLRMAQHANLSEKEKSSTLGFAQRGAIVPIHTYLPAEVHGEHVYPPWLWPGSVVDELYDISVELASSFDWPQAAGDNFSGTRPRSETAAWFVLTGEAPQVRPIEARWETKQGSTHLNPQWRIRLTIPPWLPEEEVLRAFRRLRKDRPQGRKLPKTARPLEVACFVWERERLDGYREPAPWKAWFERWNEEHPGHRFKTAGNFQEYFFRGNTAVKSLNFEWPRFSSETPEAE